MALELPPLVLGDLRIRIPIIQGGMGVGVSKASLAAAVSREGGLGVIASVGLGEKGCNQANYEELSSNALREEIRKVKSEGLPVGVNIMVALSNYESLVRTCVEENVDVIISGAGLPLRLPQYAKGSSTKLVPIISSERAAQLVLRTWLRKYDCLPEGIIIEGPKAGGHLGFSFEMLAGGTADPLEELIPKIRAIIKGFDRDIPIIAAGGVYTGKDIAGLLNLGASGVQMGTRFVATNECDASDAYKQEFVRATREDIVVIQSPVGMPARVINNDFVERSQQGKKKDFICPYKCLLSCDAEKANYCIAGALLKAARGNFKNAFAMCGENAYRIKEIVSVKALMDELVQGAIPYLA